MQEDNKKEVSVLDYVDFEDTGPLLSEYYSKGWRVVAYQKSWHEDFKRFLYSFVLEK